MGQKAIVHISNWLSVEWKKKSKAAHCLSNQNWYISDSLYTKW